VFDVFIIELIGEGAGDEVGVEPEGELDDWVIFDTEGIDGLGEVGERSACKFHDLIVRMYFGCKEYFIFKNCEGVVQVDFNWKFLVVTNHAKGTEILCLIERLFGRLIECRGSKGEYNGELLGKIYFRERKMHEIEIVE
jgi:hypothetical protein